MKTRFLTAVIAVIFMLLTLAPVAYADAPLDIPTTEAVVIDTPPGTGTVIDYTSDGAGKVFYTITTADEHIFYLVIDHERSADNVYFLNAVTVDDLIPLAAPSKDKGADESVSVIPETPTVTIPPPEPIPEPEPEPVKRGGDTGLTVFFIIALLAGGGAGFYFKIHRPKQQGANNAEAEDYIPEYEDEQDDWGAPDDWDAEYDSDDNQQ